MAETWRAPSVIILMPPINGIVHVPAKIAVARPEDHSLAVVAQKQPDNHPTR